MGALWAATVTVRPSARFLRNCTRNNPLYTTVLTLLLLLLLLLLLHLPQSSDHVRPDAGHTKPQLPQVPAWSNCFGVRLAD